MNSNFQCIDLKKLVEQNINDINSLNSIQNSYFKTLSYLSSAPSISNDFFIQRVNEISNIGTIIVCYLLNDNINSVNNFKKIIVIGTGTIIFEPKLIHEGRYAGHIEDIVVHEDYRGYGIAKNILKRLKDAAIDKYCYKIILDCKDDLCDFYSKNGFEKHGAQMKLYLN
jgi:ribosomal protein S18 acetylase RimI-like enzyme